MGWMVDGVGRLLAHYLEKPVQGYEPFTPSDPDALRATLQPGDVLLVEGNNHISGVIKYLTQSTWSHAALYVGPIGDRATSDGEPLVLVPILDKALLPRRYPNMPISTPGSAVRRSSTTKIARGFALTPPSALALITISRTSST